MHLLRYLALLSAAIPIPLVAQDATCRWPDEQWRQARRP
jgi:hypothetical protein